MIKHVILLVALAAAPVVFAESPIAPDAEIQKIIADRIDTQRQSVGIVVGVIEPAGRRVVSHGSLAKGDTRPLNGDTLDRQLPLPALAAPAQHTEVKIDPKLYDQYVGRYQLAPSMILTVSRNDDRLLVQLTGQPAFEIFAEAEKRFFLKVVDAQLTFETDDKGKATAVVLHQNGLDQRAARIEGEPVVPKEITVDPAVLDRYAGRYQLAPAATMTLSREGAKFYIQLTGQPRLEIFASGERDFFLKVVDAQLTMEVDAQGRATAVTLHQFGRDQRAPRIE